MSPGRKTVWQSAVHAVRPLAKANAVASSSAPSVVSTACSVGL